MTDKEKQSIYSTWLRLSGNLKATAKHHKVSYDVVAKIATRELHRQRGLTKIARSACYDEWHRPR